MPQLTVFELFGTETPPQAALEVLATSQALPATELSPKGPHRGVSLTENQVPG